MNIYVLPKYISAEILVSKSILKQTIAEDEGLGGRAWKVFVKRYFITYLLVYLGLVLK